MESCLGSFEEYLPYASKSNSLSRSVRTGVFPPFQWTSETHMDASSLSPDDPYFDNQF